MERGFRDIKPWIGPLVDPEFNATPANPPPPSYGAPPLPQSPAPGASKLVSLSMFNEMAMQRGLTIEWSANQNGPGHSLTWVVQCIGEYDR
jgi:hypothetical protein